MLLQALRDYAEACLDLPPPMYQEQSIRYFITLRGDGSYAGYRDTASSAERALKNGLRHQAPHVKRSSGIRPKLLADNASYVLGIAPPEGNIDRVRQQHAEFVALVGECNQATGEPAVGAVVAFLRSLDVAMLELRRISIRRLRSLSKLGPNSNCRSICARCSTSGPPELARTMMPIRRRSFRASSAVSSGQRWSDIHSRSKECPEDRYSRI